MNSSHNNPTKSPNYAKMNYLIEKLHEKENFLERRERYTTNITEKEIIKRKQKDPLYPPGLKPFRGRKRK